MASLKNELKLCFLGCAPQHQRSASANACLHLSKAEMESPKRHCGEIDQWDAWAEGELKAMVQHGCVCPNEFCNFEQAETVHENWTDPHEHLVSAVVTFNIVWCDSCWQFGFHGCVDLFSIIQNMHNNSDVGSFFWIIGCCPKWEGAGVEKTSHFSCGRQGPAWSHPFGFPIFSWQPKSWFFQSFQDRLNKGTTISQGWKTLKASLESKLLQSAGAAKTHRMLYHCCGIKSSILVKPTQKDTSDCALQAMWPTMLPPWHHWHVDLEEMKETPQQTLWNNPSRWPWKNSMMHWRTWRCKLVVAKTQCRNLRTFFSSIEISTNVTRVIPWKAHENLAENLQQKGSDSQHLPFSTLKMNESHVFEFALDWTGFFGHLSTASSRSRGRISVTLFHALCSRFFLFVHLQMNDQMNEYWGCSKTSF